MQDKIVLTPTDVKVLSASRPSDELSIAQVAVEARLAPQVMKRSLSRLQDQGLLVAADELGVLRLTDAGVKVRKIVVPKKRRGRNFIEQPFGSLSFFGNQRGQGAQPKVFVIRDDDEVAVHGMSSTRFDKMSSDELDKALEKVLRQKALE
jgi:hypothetical protein